MKYIGKFNTTKTDGSVTYTQTEVYKGEVTEDAVRLLVIETGYHNGGQTVRTTEKNYPVSVLEAFTGEYNPVTDEPVLDMVKLGTIFQNFGITLQL